MSPYELPYEIEVDGTSYPIRTDFRAVMDIISAMNDSELSDLQKADIFMHILFYDYPENINPDHVEELYKQACLFVDGGMEHDESKNRPSLVYWEQDAPILIPAINKVAHCDIRGLKELHWWTFLGWFMEIDESLFSSVISIRSKKMKGKKLEKHEKEFEKENKHLIERRLSEEEREKKRKEVNALEKWL